MALVNSAIITVVDTFYHNDANEKVLQKQGRPMSFIVN